MSKLVHLKKYLPLVLLGILSLASCGEIVSSSLSPSSSEISTVEPGSSSSGSSSSSSSSASNSSSSEGSSSSSSSSSSEGSSSSSSEDSSSSSSSSSSQGSSSSGSSSSSSSSSGDSYPTQAYYSAIDFTKTGATLKSSLATLINPHTAGTYKGLWTSYKTTDVDSNGKIIDMYSNYHWTPVSAQCGSYSVEGDCYNREHTIPQSIFGEASPMVCDLFHVYPTDGKVNGTRSNYPHGNVTTASYTSGNGSKLGTGTNNYNYTSTVFEPIDEYKGDFARTYFYFVTCYQSRMSGYSFDTFAKNTYPSLAKWAINVYLDWNDKDPVSEKETKRNEAVYKIQNNRNPFIDCSKLAHQIWDSAR